MQGAQLFITAGVFLVSDAQLFVSHQVDRVGSSRYHVDLSDSGSTKVREPRVSLAAVAVQFSCATS